MVKLLINWVVCAISVWIVSQVVPGITVKDFTSALIAAVFIGLVNALVRPVLSILTLPINILTLGLFTLVINALLLMLAAYLAPGFEVNGFLAAILGSLALSFVSTILHIFFR